MLTIRIKNEVEFDEYFFGENVNHDEIYRNIIQEIKAAMSRNDDTAWIAEIYFSDGYTQALTMDCDIDEWIENLNSSLKYYLQEEAYEKCSDIRDLIQKVHQYIHSFNIKYN